jgi:hypothetical protein
VTGARPPARRVSRVVNHTAVFRVGCMWSQCYRPRVCVPRSSLERASEHGSTAVRQSLTGAADARQSRNQRTRMQGASRRRWVTLPVRARSGVPFPSVASASCQGWREASVAGSFSAKSRHISSPFLVVRPARSRMQRERGGKGRDSDEEREDRGTIHACDHLRSQCSVTVRLAWTHWRIRFIGSCVCVYPQQP